MVRLRLFYGFAVLLGLLPACGSSSQGGGKGNAAGAAGASGGGPGGNAGTAAGGSSGSAAGGSGASSGAGAAGASGGSAGSGPVGSPDDAPGSPLSFVATDELILNPERGFYTTANLAGIGNVGFVRGQGKTLLYAAAHLDDYLGSDHEQDLPQALLDDVQAGFDAIRDAGLKAVVRFQYDNGEGYPDGANDAPESWMLRHIEQLAPVLQANADVLFVLQAGFIGAWGEWHTSLNFSDGPGDQEARKRIVDALLEAAPEARVALRYPAYKRMFYGNAATSQADLLAGADIARVGHLNDCFVSSDNDVGTYQYEDMVVLKDYLEQDTAYVPIGGETCAEHARNACDVTVPEMERFHWTYINDDYHQGVLDRWDSEGCRPEIERRLGYRLALTAGELPAAVRPGGTFVLSLEFENQGFAALTHWRPVLFVLEGQGQRFTVELDADPRLWLPGTHTLAAHLRLPAELPLGTYRVALWLPDRAESLRDRPEYALRFANEDVWNESAGDNTLSELEVLADGPGEPHPEATASLEVIP